MKMKRTKAETPFGKHILHSRQTTRAKSEPVAVVTKGVDWFEKMLRGRVNVTYISR